VNQPFSLSEQTFVDMSVQYPLATYLHRILRKYDRPYFANHSIWPVMQDVIKSDQFEKLTTDEEVRWALIEELTNAFQHVLYAQVIDTDNDPNSAETPRRLAKMYVNELFEGRYQATPKITAFPNDKPAQYEEAASGKSTPNNGDIYHFNNLLVVQSPFISNCSHHHQTVRGIAYVGIIPGRKLIGLSKYTRLIQHIAARGTLQEELTIDIADALQGHTESADIAVVIFGRHGCCENRGIKSNNSQTSTAEMRGLFMKDGKLREEFYDNLKMMRNEQI